MPITWISSTAYVGVLLICVPSRSSIALFTFHPLSPSYIFIFFFYHCFLFSRRYYVKRCLILPQRAWPPFNLRLSIAGFNHGLGSINEDDGDKGKDYGADTLSSLAKRLDSNGGSLLRICGILSNRS